MPLSVRLSVKYTPFVPMVSWLEFVDDYGLTVLDMDVLLHLLDVWHHLYVAAVDVYLNVVLFLLAHIFDIILLFFVIVIFHHCKYSSRSTNLSCFPPHIHFEALAPRLLQLSIPQG